VLPEQTALPPDLEAALVGWVQRGGRLIATGRVGPRLNEDIPTFALEAVLGVRWTGGKTEGDYLMHRGLPLQVAAPVCQVAAYGADVVRPLLRSPHEGRMQDTGYPAVTRHRFGEGEAFYVAADLFAAYHRCQYPGLRELVGDLFELALPEAPLLTTAPPTLEIALRERGDMTLVQFVNHAPGKSLAQNSAFIESVPSTPGFSLTLALAERPEEVRLQPGGAEPEWSYAEGTLTAFIPPVHLHATLAIRRPASG
jgi:hypothetical protein